LWIDDDYFGDSTRHPTDIGAIGEIKGARSLRADPVALQTRLGEDQQLALDRDVERIQHGFQCVSEIILSGTQYCIFISSGALSSVLKIHLMLGLLTNIESKIGKPVRFKVDQFSVLKPTAQRRYKTYHFSAGFLPPPLLPPNRNASLNSDREMFASPLIPSPATA
jgi:hypothetical protein